MIGSRQDVTIDSMTFTDVTKHDQATTSLWNQSAQSPLTHFGYLPRDIARSVIDPMLSSKPFDPKKLIPFMQGIPKKSKDPAYQEIQSAFGWTQATVLLQYVVCGDQDAAEAIVKANPALLLERATVTDYSGRRIEGTALQLALGAEDVGYHPGEKCMVEMLTEYFTKLKDGDVEIAKQTREQFPDCWEDCEAERQARDRAALHAVINTIAEPAGDNDEGRRESIKNAIQAFQAYLAYENSHLIKTGKHFSHLLLIEALDLIRQNFIKFGGINSRKNKVVWREIMGAIQRKVPAATAQALCTDLSCIVDGHEKIVRSFMMKNIIREVLSFFPLDINSEFILGRDFAVEGCFVSRTVHHFTLRLLASSWKTYVEQKHQTCKTYLLDAQTRTTGLSGASLLR